ncbi:ATP12 family chaperone protein [Phaeobacter marinintestinus]|uniref:ATP12 family chaperone protein n=1 Tax=Falsiphaeobacter marinintestinus TaxID=1492905 RepID=UPI0011B5C483|nr:ATP12 family protein [Phaeobacter marinintestinus]
MTEWKQKRFWKTVSVEEADDGYTVALDGRLVKTPAKAALVVPSRGMADSIAGEWDAQTEKGVDPGSMPMTRSANAAIDKVAVQHAEVADMLAAYGDCDLLCYRADSPQALVRRQADLWDPALDWAADTLGVRLTVQTGLMHKPQDAEGQQHLAAQVHALSPFQLAAFHDLVSLSGSLVLGFATARGWRDAESIWALSRVDETWQEEQWGADDEAQAVAERKRQEFLHAKRFFDLA